MATSAQTNTTLGEMAALMRGLDDFVLCGHVSPDGDCLGSQLALYHALRAIGKRACCLLVKDEPTPVELAFLPGIDDMVPACRFDGKAHTFVALDVPTRERIGEDACKILDSCEASFMVDHHPCDAPIADFVFANPDAASASMLVWELVKALVQTPPEQSALCAYVGLLTDTGGFRYQNSDPLAFAAAGELVGFGVDPSDVAMHVYQNRSLASLKLEALTIERMRVFANGKAALSWITADDMESLGATKADAEPLVDVLRSVIGVRAVCMLREQDGCVRGSLRAKDDSDVSTIARMLGGGGHKSASGFTLHLAMHEAIDLIELKLRELTDGCPEA